MPDEENVQTEVSEITPEPTPNIIINNPTPEGNIPVSENIPETLREESTPPEEIPVAQNNTNVVVEKTPNTVTITEVMQPEVSKTVFDTSNLQENVAEQSKSFLRGLLPKLKEKLAFRTEKRLAKIMELARKKGEIQNDDVQKLLRVSDASASNYLTKLVQRGNLKISGSKNHSKYLPS